jgi:hypothetical protein
MIGNKEIGRVE